MEFIEKKKALIAKINGLLDGEPHEKIRTLRGYRWERAVYGPIPVETLEAALAHLNAAADLIGWMSEKV